MILRGAFILTVQMSAALRGKMKLANATSVTASDRRSSAMLESFRLGRTLPAPQASGRFRVYTAGSKAVTAGIAALR